MNTTRNAGSVRLGLWFALVIAFMFPYISVFRTLLHIWLNDADFSYGILMPAIVGYLIWKRRSELACTKKIAWTPALYILLAASALQVLASLSDTLIFSVVAFTLSLMGIVGFLWGRQCLRVVVILLALLILMVPIPSYVLGQLTWYLQVAASTISAALLGFIGVPVYQDGNLLTLPNYVLEVKEACSGSHSIFALLAMALVLAVGLEQKWRVRLPLVITAPVLAVAANVFRIVGTGLLAWWFGSLAANESLHEAWGILVFMLAATGLLAFERFLKWATSAYA